MNHVLLLRHLIVPCLIIEGITGWHPVWVWIYTPLNIAWAIFLYANARNPGWLVVYHGALLNKICVIANGGYMPVGGNLLTVTEGKHTPLRPDHVLVGLADIHGGASIGDFVILTGLGLVLGIFILRKTRSKRDARR